MGRGFYSYTIVKDNLCNFQYLFKSLCWIPVKKYCPAMGSILKCLHWDRVSGVSRLLKNSFDLLGRHSCGSRNPGFPVKTGTQIFFTGSPLPRGQRLDSRSLLKTCRDKLRGSDGKLGVFRILLGIFLSHYSILPLFHYSFPSGSLRSLRLKCR